MTEKLRTWGKRSLFKYEGNPIESGTRIYYGKNFKTSAKVTANQYRDLLNHFKGKRVLAGTSRDKAPKNSLGEWLQKNVSKTALASYVGSILVKHGFASKQGAEIVFKRIINGS